MWGLLNRLHELFLLASCNPLPFFSDSPGLRRSDGVQVPKVCSPAEVPGTRTFEQSVNTEVKCTGTFTGSSPHL